MYSAPISEPIRCHTDVLYTGLNTRKIPQEKLPREIFCSIHEIRNSLRVFPFLRKKQLFQLGFDAVHGAVVFVVENFSNKRRHGLNEPRDDLIKIFKFLKTQITIFQIYSRELESILLVIFRHQENLGLCWIKQHFFRGKNLGCVHTS